MDRRTFIQATAGITVVSAAPGMWSRPVFAASVGELAVAAKAAGQTKVVLSIGGGTFIDVVKDVFFDPFTKETGIEAVFVTSGDYSSVPAQVRAMSEAKAMEWDIISTTYDSVRAPEFANYVEDMGDCSELSNVVSEGVEGSCLGNSVLMTLGGSVLTYNTQEFPNGMKNWVDFWDVKTFPGPRTLPNNGSPWYVLSAALVADGVPADKVYPLDLDRAFKKLDELKPHIVAWWVSGDQSQQLFRSKEVVAGMIWNGRAAGLRSEGAPVTFVWIGAVFNADTLSITKGAPHPIAAKALLNYFYTRPEAHAEFVKRMNYVSPNKHVGEFLEARVASDIVSAPQNWPTLIRADPVWVAENRQKVIERWTAWVSA
ncbi:ABC transporter substrate-binding protein [Mesorhizobium sp. Cs1299R1N1]|uniref:ABC transporter substrate-binding protein n=1 Tax=Mesorhizobium sp. Cs1299R1N1 TaxID=3015172 RepID=UPI00301C2B7B